MCANIFLHEFRARLRSVIIWSLSLTFLIVFFFAMFPIFADEAALMNEFLARYPQELRSAFGMDKVDLATVLGESENVEKIKQVGTVQEMLDIFWQNAGLDVQ